MSTFSRRTVTCHCGTAFEGEVFDSLHVSRRPDVRDRILEGTFHTFPCPGCGERVVVEARLAYTDFPRKHWFTVYPRIDLRHRTEMADFAARAFRATMVDRAPELVRDWAPDMLQRVIFGLASLREKLIIFDANLDDRLIEILKLQLFRTTRRLLFHPDTFLFLSEIESDTLIFDYAPPGKETVSLPVPRELYVDLAGRCDALLRDQPWLSDGFVVDYRAIVTPDLPLARAEEPQ